MMSSILNSDFISTRLIVHGISLENNGIRKYTVVNIVLMLLTVTSLMYDK